MSPTLIPGPTCVCHFKYLRPFEYSELTARFGKCTALLLPTLRTTFQLRVVDGLSIIETAGILEHTASAAHPRDRPSSARSLANVLKFAKRLQRF